MQKEAIDRKARMATAMVVIRIITTTRVENPIIMVETSGANQTTLVKVEKVERSMEKFISLARSAVGILATLLIPRNIMLLPTRRIFRCLINIPQS